MASLIDHPQRNNLNESSRIAFFRCEDGVSELVILNDGILAARTGEDAVDVAVRDHARLVYRICYSALRNHQDAEDATQDTFVRVVRYRRKLEEARDSRSWVARIAWRVAVERRRVPRHTGLEEMDSAISELRSSLASAEDVLLGTEMTELLERLMVGLPPKLRDPLTLSSLEEMSTADIASLLEISEAAVRSRIARARQVLKEKLASLLERKHAT